MANIDDTAQDTATAAGRVVSVRGAVVDVAFGDGSLPAVHTALDVQWDRP